MNTRQRFRAAIAVAAIVCWCACTLLADDPAKPEPSAKATKDAARKELAEKAKAVHAEADKLFAQRHYDDASERLEELLAVLEELYPSEKHPNGDRDTAQALLSLGIVSKAAGHAERAQQSLDKSLQMYRRLYPKAQFPDGHLDILLAIGSLALVLQEKGCLRDAQGLFEEALEMTRRLFPPEKHPNGHALILAVLQKVGLVLTLQGENARAVPYYRESLTVCEHLYPKDQFPEGHLEVATQMTSLAFALQGSGDLSTAHKLFSEALAMVKRLFPLERNPNGHASVVAALQNLAHLLWARGDPASAASLYREAVEVCERLYPSEAYPTGHAQFAQTLLALGSASAQAGDSSVGCECLERSLKMFRTLYPPASFPDGHLDIACTLVKLGAAFCAERRLDDASDAYERALKMFKRLVPTNSDVAVQRNVADALMGLGAVADSRGDFSMSRRYYERALNIFQLLYPTDSYPGGHPDLAMAIQGVAVSRQAEGDFVAALSFSERATEMLRRCYSPIQYPVGHPRLAEAIVYLAGALLDTGDPIRAERLVKESLAMQERVYTKERYPDGHPSLATAFHKLGHVQQYMRKCHKAMESLQRALEIYEQLSRGDNPYVSQQRTAEILTGLGEVAQSCGEIEQADDYFKKALAVQELLFPHDRFPAGHRELVRTLLSAGRFYLARGDARLAADFVWRCHEMRRSQTDEFVSSGSEAEALNFAATMAPVRDYLISAWQKAARSDDDLYSAIWRDDGAVGRTLLDRRRGTIGRASDKSVLLFQAYFAAKRQLARLTLSPVGADSNQSGDWQARIWTLNQEKERLERELAESVPDFARQQSLPRRAYIDLIEDLPQDGAYLHLVRYRLVEASLKDSKWSEQRTPNYAAFVVARYAPTDMIQLGPAEPIDAAVREWRQAIAEERASDAPVTLRRLVWEPIQKKLPPKTATVYLHPEGPLTAMPWSALPGKAPGSALLEEYSLALIPYGPFLLDQLTAPPRTKSADDVLLAVGGVAYDDHPVASADAGQLAALRGEIGLEGPRIRWPHLPGTRDEVDALSSLAGDRQIIVLSGRDAGTDRVLAELAKARWAVFATHGFFADPKVRSAMQLDESIFEKRDFLMGGERTTPVGRNPLLLSGLVLAGANLPRPEDEFGIPQDDGGILSAEVISSLPLEKLELAVLSACDTGLGEVAGGEGVFGLQRAFHQAGAANVIASLWKVDDRVTAALMRLFYYKLFRENKPPLAALREAQLAIYYHPEQIGPLASARAPDFGKAVKLVDGGKSAAPNGRAATRLWAGFVLSGAGK